MVFFPVPMFGLDACRVGSLLVVERLYWKGRALPFGLARFRFAKTARQQGYWYPAKKVRDVLDEETAELEPDPVQVAEPLRPFKDSECFKPWCGVERLCVDCAQRKAAA